MILEKFGWHAPLKFENFNFHTVWRTQKCRQKWVRPQNAYSEIAEELSGISSKAAYSSKKLKKDLASYYQGATNGEVSQLDDIERADRVSPVPQLVRRFLAVSCDKLKEKRKLLAGKNEEDIMQAVEQIIAEKGIPEGANMDRIFDNLTQEELEQAFIRISGNEEKQDITQPAEGKSGLDDALEDPKTTRTSVKAATRVARENQQPRETTDKTIGE